MLKIKLVIIYKKTILVAPLNWGFGHATRCIPIINALIENDFKVLIGSDGDALRLLKQEFPKLNTIVLPSYKINYPENGKHFKKNMLLKLPQIYKAVKKEKKIINKLIKEKSIDGIISDNRLGVRNKNVTSVYLTHQLTVLSNSTTWISSSIHQYFIKKFDECWVPDYKDNPTLSGKLGRSTKLKNLITYINPLSRMRSYKTVIENDILIILSGPEPQRTLLEKLLLDKFIDSNKRVLIVCGVIEDQQCFYNIGSIKLVNYLTTIDLENAINRSKLIICRSGYTSIMDLSLLNKKTFFIPTPGQFEQEYLAKRLHQQFRIPSCSQEDFDLSKLELVAKFSGWETNREISQDFVSLFSVF